MEKLGNNIKEVQESIIKLLGFDYSTFSNTANFEQGESDSFSKLTPKEAKLVLMKILQLEQYDELEKICKEKVATFSTEYNNIFREIELTKTLEEPIEDAQPLKERVEVLHKFIADMQSEINKAKNEIVFETKLKELINAMEKFEKLDKCPSCLQAITEEHKKIILTKYKEAIDSTKKLFNYEISPSTFIDNQLPRLQKLNYELAALESKLENIALKQKRQTEVTNKREELEQKLNQIKSEIETYKKLTIAFGKNGIPSYIIENIVPEIESIVNDLLQMLEVDFIVTISTQKELKSGGISDTLDILIVRGNSVKPYTNYSGGEKFLIDFVLRIALSVVLLRRKGCNNSTLILDEGMGSLDSENRDKFVRLVNIVKEKFGFKKVLVITHMDDIKDNFINKISVEKKNGISHLCYNSNKEDHQ